MVDVRGQIYSDNSIGAGGISTVTTYQGFLDTKQTIKSSVSEGTVVAGTLSGEIIVDGLNGLPGFRCRTPGGAFYAFPNIEETGLDARSLQKRLLEEAGVATVAGTSFGHLGEGFIRFSYANSVDNIKNALKRIASLLVD